MSAPETSSSATARRAARRARRAAKREPSLLRAVLLGLLASLVVGVIAFEAQVNTPGTAIYNLYRLLVVNGQVSPQSGIVQQFLSEIRWQDILIVSFASQLVGGLVLGFFAPKSARRRRVLGVAAAAALLSVLAWAAATWGVQAEIAGGHINSRALTGGFVVRQSLWSLAWAAAFVVGTALALFMRKRA